ncbi:MULTISPECIES: phosphoribosyltransferase family protein [Streptomyces]|uniref:Phosphoribosyltransferase family protein n=1 Tax=Streptomyces solicathayae TaxID=3081768 RepID=A0ABZ0LMF3_9ACTN|nr:alpha/beta family hydrolase [Streptomyces sp. HUAS YS2]WOX20626.1 phosphoribosyltransferase family protein [Streptomyces sp. HUAS YS2]
MYFTDRIDAGRQLAALLTHLKDSDAVVLGLPRGGVPVAEQVAEALAAPLDICLVRKLGVPYQPELAMGAVGEGGVRVLNEDVIGRGGVSAGDLAAVEERELALLAERAARYRGARQPVPLRGRTVVVVDDGLATGATALAACQVVRARGAARIVLAVPVAPGGWRAERVGSNADDTVCVHEPVFFRAIGQFYADFSQTPDEEVIACLDRNRAAYGSGDGSADGAAGLPPTEVRLPVGGAEVGGELTLPPGAAGIVLFAHGSGSSRHSPRNRAVAAALNRAGLGTLLFDLLTDAEAADRANVFDTELLAGRLAEAAAWVGGRDDTRRLRTGFFGASTGAAAALWAAADPAATVAAVVSRGGRPDLADARLAEVRAPTLLIVGGRDDLVLDLNRAAQARLRCENRLEIVPGATHLFEEAGTLEKVGELAAAWFADHF